MIDVMLDIIIKDMPPRKDDIVICKVNHEEYQSAPQSVLEAIIFTVDCSDGKVAVMLKESYMKKASDRYPFIIGPAEGPR